VIHGWFVDAAQAHPSAVATAMLPFPPVAASVALAGVNTYPQVFAACVTVNMRPAIKSVPRRCAVLVLGAIVKVTEPLPDPLAPEVTLIQAELATAVHKQPVCVVTAVEIWPPAAGTD